MMKTLLILSSDHGLIETLRSALPAERYRLIHRLTIDDAEPFTVRGMIDICLLDDEFTGIQTVWAIEKIRRRLPHAPLVVCTDTASPDWIEDAFLQGVAHVLSKPLRPRMLNVILERLLAPPAPSPAPSAAPRDILAPAPMELPRAPRAAHSASEALGVLSNFSGILTHSLNAEALLREFLLQLRAILGVNRAAIFLRQPVTALTRATAGDPRSMRSACALGLAAGLLEHFELSFETGIGGHLHREGRILRSDSFESRHDPEMRKEFELLGAQVAIPILDRETLVGVAVFDGRVTGEPLVNGELELVFHLLEELGLAVKNIWLHSQLAANHEMMADVLRELSSACVVVSRDLAVLHANKAARQMFARGKRGGDLDFSDLPQALGSKVYQVLQTGSGIATFKHHPADPPGASHSVTILPLTRAGATSPASVLLMVEDRTQSEQLRELEIEAANLRLVKGMADRIAHEVGNAMVPLSTHQQLLGEKFRDAEFRSSLDLALTETVKRVNRLINQMRYLARDAVLSRESLPLGQLLEEAFKEAHKHQPAKTAKLQFENSGNPVVLAGDRAALRHAFSEVLLNAIQANPADARIKIKASTDNDPQGQEWVHIDVADNGAGFTAEAAQKVPTPFFTTRTVGLGLGLCVARKVLETHQGRLSILTQAHGQSNSVRLSLPVQPAPAEN